MAMNEGSQEGGYRAGIEIGPDGEPTGNIICYPSSSPNCKVVRLPQTRDVDSTGFLSLPEPTPYHDQLLQDATGEINKVLTAVLTKAGVRARNLHVVLAKDGPMLVWTQSMAMELDDVATPPTKAM